MDDQRAETYSGRGRLKENINFYHGNTLKLPLVDIHHKFDLVES